MDFHAEVERAESSYLPGEQEKLKPEVERPRGMFFQSAMTWKLSKVLAKPLTPCTVTFKCEGLTVRDDGDGNLLGDCRPNSWVNYSTGEFTIRTWASWQDRVWDCWYTPQERMR